jgi:uncharacterized protein YndB with AHSA1/START domain
MPRDDVTEIELIDDCTARLERIFRCTPEVLWDVMTDPARFPEWWGPAHHSPTVVEMDVRVGGRWRFELNAHENVFGFGGEYLEIERPALLVQTFVFDPFPDGGTVERATLEAQPDGSTLFRVDVTHPTPEGRTNQLSSGMLEGMQETHRRLAALVAQA